MAGSSNDMEAYPISKICRGRGYSETEKPSASDILSQTITTFSVKVPLGHIVVSGKWRNTDLVERLQSSIPVHFEDCLGVVDFHTSNYTGIIYISEADIVSPAGYRRKLAKLRKANKVRGIVIAEETPLSKQYLMELQKFANLELGLVLIYVQTEKEGAELLIQMVNVESRNDVNVFMKKPKNICQEEAVLATMRCIPKLGDVKAKLILQKYKSLKDICNVSHENKIHLEKALTTNKIPSGECQGKSDLSVLVGPASAKNVKNFFNNSD